MSEQTEITFMQTRLIRLASDCCSIGSPAVYRVYRYDDRTGGGKSLRHAGTGRIRGNNAGGECFFPDFRVHRECGFAVCFPEPWRKQNPAHQKRLPCSIDIGCVLCSPCFPYY